jgi:hypothetical protein
MRCLLGRYCKWFFADNMLSGPDDNFGEFSMKYIWSTNVNHIYLRIFDHIFDGDRVSNT